MIFFVGPPNSPPIEGCSNVFGRVIVIDDGREATSEWIHSVL
jgi:hypothetical protein